MTKQQLQTILSSPYNQAIWKQVLIEIFGVKRILQTPQPILLANVQKASEVYELGSFSTKDDRIIGIYQVNVKLEVWLERNKVGLRTLLRDIYKYDVDGALIVFVQENKWRLSFVSEIKTLNEKGEIQTQATEPKRYTYLLGEGEKVLTPAQNLAKIAGKPLTLEDIRNAFSVEALNEEFYKIIAQQFYELVGATSGKGKNSRTYERKLQLPSTSDAKTYQEFAVRLIGRTIFCWFLKVKKSEAGISLLPEHLLGSYAINEFSNYYHTILERLFFQTLNTPAEKRLSNLPEGANQIPFLNGGLFDYQEDDFYTPNRITGLSENINTLIIPDQWFLSFFQELEKFNFTIDENSTVDIEVSVDPEMLGRIFENLLAEIDPDSGETARKATGSFYTPREIVDYMATESLVHYLHNKTGIEKETLSTLFKIDIQVSHDSMLTTKKVAILEALDTLKILDPACGSGAFPMGVLQKIVMALQKIDPKSEWWKNKQIEKNDNPVLRSIIREKLNGVSVEYARKIGIIQNSLYGVDIQPIASEISKLRCFLTLIVDENIDENKPNRGVEPLPNLEFKFVTADSLHKLPKENNYGGLFNANDDLEQLKRIRQDYLQSFGENKSVLKNKFKEIQDRIAQQQFNLGKNIDLNSRAYMISIWKPFSHEKVAWFDPEWMFGVKNFDIVIGNPPYISHDKISADDKKYYKENYQSFEAFADLYCYFIEDAIKSLNDVGVSCLITSNSYLRAEYGKKLRGFIYKGNTILQIISIEDIQIFDSAIVNTAISMVQKGETKQLSLVLKSIYNFKDNFTQFVLKNSFYYTQQDFRTKSWTLISPNNLLILRKISSNHLTLEQLGTKIRLGLATGDNNAFIINQEKKEYFEKQDSKNSEIIKPILRGRDIERYYYNEVENYILLTKNGINVEKEYPTLYKYFDSLGDSFKKRGAKGQHWTNLRACSFFDDFKEVKIIWIELTDIGRFALCTDEIYLLNSAYFLLPPKGYSAKYLLAILNSKTIRFFLEKTAETSGMGTSRWINNYVKEFPIPDTFHAKVFEIIVEYILILNALSKETQIDKYVPNSHIVQVFEEVIDAMVYELYFTEDFKAVNIEFIKYAERDFPSIEDINDELEKKKTIYEAYQKLREKDNEIRNNLKLMLIELKDLIMPIKTAK